MKPLRLNFLDMPLDAGVTVDSICDLIAKSEDSHFISFVNPQSWAMALRQPDYVDGLKQITHVLPDGGSVAYVCRLITRLECPRVSFDMSSLAGPFFDTLAREGAGVMLVGGKPGVTEQAADKLRKNYRGLSVVACDDGYGPLDTKVANIMRVNPRVVIIGMGVPYQEKALLALRQAGFAGVAITCGGFFDQYLQSETYYPAWVDRLNLRFAYRIYMEPARLWRRYLIDYQVFIWRALAALPARADWRIERPA